MKIIANCETGEIITEDYSPEELIEIEAKAKIIAAEQIAKDAELAAKAAARQALLEKLGITEEEAKLLFS